MGGPGIPSRMFAMVLTRPLTSLAATSVPTPQPGPGELLIRVEACGVCRTDLNVVDGELTEPKLPLIPGHESVGVGAQCDIRRYSHRRCLGKYCLRCTCAQCRLGTHGEEQLRERVQF